MSCIWYIFKLILSFRVCKAADSRTRQERPTHTSCCPFYMKDVSLLNLLKESSNKLDKSQFKEIQYYDPSFAGVEDAEGQEVKGERQRERRTRQQ